MVSINPTNKLSCERYHLHGLYQPNNWPSAQKGDQADKLLAPSERIGLSAVLDAETSA
jgi:hypothetical protein